MKPYPKAETKDYVDTSGALLLILCSTLVGLNQVIIKLVNEGMHPVFQAGLRSVCAILPILFYMWLRNRPFAIARIAIWPGVLAGLFFSAEFYLLFQALDFTSVSRASIFFYTMPFWTAIAAHFLIPGENLTGVKIVGLLLAIAGVVIALADRSEVTGVYVLVGDVLCLIAALFWSGIILVAKKTRFSDIGPELQLLYQLAVSAMVLLSLSTMLDQPIRNITPIIIGLFSFQVIVVVCFSFLCWFWLLSVYPAGSMAAFSFLSPVMGVFFGWLILGEQLTVHILLALALVSLGVYLVNKKPTTEQVKHG